jgi:hypothetical protein
MSDDVTYEVRDTDVGKVERGVFWVIQYGKHLAYVDERGVKHDSWGLLFRDADHIEKYANAWWTHCKRTGQPLVPKAQEATA